MKALFKKRLLSLSIIILFVLVFFTLIFHHQINTLNPKNKDEIIEQYTPASIQKEIDSFTLYTNSLVPKMIRSSPLSASFMYGNLESLGLYELNSLLDDFSYEYFQSEFLNAQNILLELSSIDYTLLTKEQKSTYEILKFQNQLILDSKPFLYYEHTIEPSSGIQMNLLLSLIQMELENDNDIRSYLTRLNQVPRLFNQIIEYESIKIKKGLLMPKELYSLVLEQLDNLLVEPNRFIIYLSFIDQIEQIKELDVRKKEDYKKECLSIIANKIYPSYDVLKETIKHSMEISSTRQGVCSFDKGKEYYSYIIKKETSYDMSPEDMLAWVSNQLYTTLEQIQTLYFNYPELLEYEDFSKVMPTYNSLEDLYAIEEKCLADLFYDYGIERASENIIPSYLEEYIAAGFYFPISIDGKSYGNMYLQEDFYKNINANTLELYFHENIPGHHFYFSKFYGSDLPMIRKILTWLPYEEGWAQYIQGISIDYYGLSEPLTQLLKATSNLSSYYMLLVDIKYHYDGISYEEATNMLLDLGFPEASAIKIVNRMVAHPGEIIHYIFGGYKIESYLTQCKQALGIKFNIKDFHDMILKNAETPFYYMDKIVDRYIKEKM